METRIRGIYSIINKISNKKYIGESLDIDRRWEEHISDLNGNIHKNYKLQSDWNEYGKDSFEFNVELTLDEDIKYYIDKFICVLFENQLICKYDSINNGYNIENTLAEILNGHKNLQGETDNHTIDFVINEFRTHKLYIENSIIYYDKQKVVESITPIENKNESYIIIPNEYYIDSQFSNEELVIYCLMQRNFIIAKSYGICSINFLKELMYIEHRNSRVISTIKNGITQLIKKGIIYNITDIHFNAIDYQSLNNDTLFYYNLDLPIDKYYKVYDNHIDDIFKYLKDNQSNINKFSLIRYFIAICRVISNQSNFGFLTQKSIHSICGKSETIQRYNKILQNDVKAIRYNNDYMTKERHYMSTFFGWYDDKTNYDFQLQTYIDTHELILTNKINSNENRSNTQIKNILNKKGDN